MKSPNTNKFENYALLIGKNKSLIFSFFLVIVSIIDASIVKFLALNFIDDVKFSLLTFFLFIVSIISITLYLFIKITKNNTQINQNLKNQYLVENTIFYIQTSIIMFLLIISLQVILNWSYNKIYKYHII